VDRQDDIAGHLLEAHPVEGFEDEPFGKLRAGQKPRVFSA